MAFLLFQEETMRVSPFEMEAPAPRSARAADEPGDADGDARMRTRDAAEEDSGRQETIEEPGYGHGV
jgi:hypothetical protein